MPFAFSPDAVDLDFIEKMKTITGEPFTKVEGFSFSVLQDASRPP